MSDHVHAWLRLPVIDNTVTYSCEECPESHRVTWLQMVGSVSEMDTLLRNRYGGMVRGEILGVPNVNAAIVNRSFIWPLTLGGKIAQVREIGLLLETEDFISEEPDGD